MLHTRAGRPARHRVCTNIACLLAGAYELARPRRAPARHPLSARRPTDGEFTLEEAECLAGCDTAPCVQVNHRFFGALDPEASTGSSTTSPRARVAPTIPPHGVPDRIERTVGLARPRRQGRPAAKVPAERSRARAKAEPAS